MVGRIMASKGVHTLIPHTLEFVTLHDKKDFVDVIKVKDLEMGRWSHVVQMGSV